MIAYPDCGADNDQKLFFFFFFLRGGRGDSLPTPRINIFTMGNMGVREGSLFMAGGGGEVRQNQ